jgi:hypothetical protein
MTCLFVLIGFLIGIPLGRLSFNRFDKYGSGKWEL